MQLIPFGSTGRVTTCLGFGGSSLMGALNRRQSLALLESAYDAGIRHFDTAPSYGYGEAESCLGEFLARHRGDCTVTTKFGIPRAKNQPLIRLARAIVGPMVQRSPVLKRRLQGVVRQETSAVPAAVASANPIFTAEQARASLEASLRELKTDRVDLFLLHEVKAIDLAADSAGDLLLQMLESLVAAGTIGAFGVGSEGARVGELVAQHPRYCRVQQYEWSLFDDAVAESDAFRIHHRSLSANFPALVARLKAEPETLKRMSAEVGEDLGDTEMLANLMLKASLVSNPGCVILFSSKNAQHIQNNVAVAGDARLEGPARRLHECLRRMR
jgi:aryl-alcohol dehydrogenase-like predicted oxidoreductase